MTRKDEYWLPSCEDHWYHWASLGISDQVDQTRRESRRHNSLVTSVRPWPATIMFENTCFGLQ